MLADPPYNVDSADVDAILAALGTNGWTREGTVAVVERATTCAPLTWPEGWRRWPQRVYGDTRLELAERLLPTCSVIGHDRRRRCGGAVPACGDAAMRRSGADDGRGMPRVI